MSQLHGAIFIDQRSEASANAFLYPCIVTPEQSASAFGRLRHFDISDHVGLAATVFVKRHVTLASLMDCLSLAFHRPRTRARLLWKTLLPIPEMLKATELKNPSSRP